MYLYLNFSICFYLKFYTYKLTRFRFFFFFLSNLTFLKLKHIYILPGEVTYERFSKPPGEKNIYNYYKLILTINNVCAV